MIRKIRDSRSFKGLSMLVALTILSEIMAPTVSLALTGGPAQPEFSSFTPIGTSDMVDLSSGDMNYNIPLMDVGGYPINIAYTSGVGMDDEASWVGLGWNLSVGQINRNVRGIPDDFRGDPIQYENYMKPNITVGANFKFTPALVGITLENEDNNTFNSEGDSTYQPGNVTFGVSASYNNYTGFSMKPSVGITMDLGKVASVGFSAESGPDGLSVSPTVSLHARTKTENNRNNKLTTSVGVSMNYRQGLTSTSLSMNKKSTYKYGKQNNKKEGSGSSSIGSAIGFTDQTYTPSKRVGMSTKSFTVNAALGAELFGGEGQGQVTAYGTIMKVQDEDRNKTLPSYGYMNNSSGGSNAIQDFNREKDGNFSVNSTNLPLTNFTYDIYSVQGQGVAGMYRPYQNQVGYVTDAYVGDGSLSFTLGLEFGTGNAFHAGIDFEASVVQSHSGNWNVNNNMMYHLTPDPNSHPLYESVHFKNVGDLTADPYLDAMFAQTGNYQPARIAWNVNGPKFNRKLQNTIKYKYNGQGNEYALSVGGKIRRTDRLNRNQAIVNLTWQDLNNGVGYGPNVNRTGTPETLSHPAHHIAEVQIVRNDGARYIYGQAAYNIKKREATFSVENNGNCATELVSYSPNDLDNPKNLPNDRFLDRTTTPGYAHTYLLTSVLSTDYQDVNNNGPSVEDLGSYTKFTYKKGNNGAAYKWRIPYQKDMATYNEGLETDSKDQRGNYVYGEKETFLIEKIETKTHVAIFKTSPRKDAHGVIDEAGGRDDNNDSYKLDSVLLYSIREYYLSDMQTVNTNAVPIKTVHFVYDYSLCTGVPNNDMSAVTNSSNELSNEGGKLTLKKVYFTYRNSRMGKYTGYDFTYGFNPNYNIKSYDSWGNYKPANSSCANDSEPTASEFPYTEQDPLTQAQYAEAWSLKEIDLPSGGKISVQYESDDYAFVQNRKAQRMFKVIGAGNSRDPEGNVDAQSSAQLYGNQLLNNAANYLYVKVDENSSLTADDYLNEIKNSPIYFRFYTNMTPQGNNVSNINASHYDYVTGYLEYEEVNSSNGYNGPEMLKNFDHDQNANTPNITVLSIPIKVVEKEGGLFNSTGATNKVNPISKAAWHFGRKYLSQHVYSNQPNGDTEDIEAMVTELLSPNIFNNIKEIFIGPNATLENKNIGRRFIKAKSWIRLLNPNGHKLGGGARVKSIISSDVWEEMTTGQGDYQTMTYGQSYNYNLPDGTSSGVAAYEPVGNKENPFVEPVFSQVKHLLAPDEENYIEKPFGESFFPSPQVTYSRVEVSNLQNGEAPQSGYIVKKLHRTGKVVNEFYTSKDYPTIVDQTILEAKEDKNEVLSNILNLYVRKHFTATQGYVVHLNDMNGKQRSQWVYAEGQQAPISGVTYNYDNYSTPNNFSAADNPERNKGSLNNEVVVIRPDGSVGRETIGVEVDIINDFRENKTVTNVPGINANLATFFVGIIPGIVPIPLPDYSYSEDLFHSASTTKVINTFGLLKETVAYDAGAAVYTRNLAWDQSTGEVLLTETVDEYSDKYYTFNYPAHWYYKGMAQASRNIGFTRAFSEVSSGFFQLNLPQGYTSSNFLIPGDEVVISSDAFSTVDEYAWVKSVSGNTFRLMDKFGNELIGISNSSLKVVRSGHRNLQSAGVMNVTLMRNPLIDQVGGNLISSLGPNFLKASQGNWADWKIINAGAVDYSQVWKMPCECDLAQVLGQYNEYVRNERGVWRTKSSRTYLTGRNAQAEITPRQQGFFMSFSPMYQVSNNGYWWKNFNDWTYVAEVSQYSPYGFEIENKDALNRHSAAQYGYNNSFPMAVGANTKYREIGYDGFEDYGFGGCPSNAHFNFEPISNGSIRTNLDSHTGRYSIKVGGNNKATMTKQIGCVTGGAQP